MCHPNTWGVSHVFGVRHNVQTKRQQLFLYYFNRERKLCSVGFCHTKSSKITWTWHIHRKWRLLLLLIIVILEHNSYKRFNVLVNSILEHNHDHEVALDVPVSSKRPPWRECTIEGHLHSSLTVCYTRVHYSTKDSHMQNRHPTMSQPGSSCNSKQQSRSGMKLRKLSQFSWTGRIDLFGVNQ